MIKINLLGDDTAKDNSSVWYLLGYGFSVVTLVLACVLLAAGTSSEISNKTDERDALQKQFDLLNEKTKEVNLLEAKKKELAEKTQIISTLKKNRIGPVRVLDDLNISIPERSWLLDVRETASLMRILGRAIDNQTIALFMKQLDDSDYFDKVDLEETKKIDQNGVAMKEFTLKAQVSYAGKVEAPSDKPADKSSDKPSDKGNAAKKGEAASTTSSSSSPAASTSPTADKAAAAPVSANE